MQVIYKKTISEQIDEAIHKAAKEGRVIDRVVLTQNEFTLLTNELNRRSGLKRFLSRRGTLEGTREDYYCGVALEVEEEGDY